MDLLKDKKRYIIYMINYFKKLKWYKHQIQLVKKIKHVIIFIGLELNKNIEMI